MKALEEAESFLVRAHKLVGDLSPSEFGREPSVEIQEALSDDLNSPRAFALLADQLKRAGSDESVAAELAANLTFLALFPQWLQRDIDRSPETVAREMFIQTQIAARLDARRAKNFAESDRLRDELAAMGIALKDGKDPATGEPTTSWEVKR